ncbi:MAG: Ig-like domain-containing protein [Gammaproteobacteria bacterium]|nr:Ig-like domain-containing protein [Gammaproteobacteria bacterium]
MPKELTAVLVLILFLVLVGCTSEKDKQQPDEVMLSEELTSEQAVPNPSNTEPNATEQMVPSRDILPLSAVSNLKANTDAPNKISLSWKNPEDDNFQGVLLVRSNESFPLAPDSGEEVYRGSLENYSESPLPSGNYYYSVFTYDEDLNYSASVSVKASVSDIAPPASVAQFSVILSADYELSLSWKNPADVDFDRVVIVFRNDTFAKTIDDGSEVYNGKGDSTVLRKLNSGTYYFSAFSIDTSGNVAAEATVAAEAADKFAPQIVSQTPVHNSKDVERNVLFSLVFNEPIVANNYGQRIFIVNESNDDVWELGYIPHTVVSGTADKELSFNLSYHRLEFNSLYSVILEVTDLAGHKLQISRGDWQFTTMADNGVPIVTSVYPNQNYSGTRVVQEIWATISEPVEPVFAWQDTISINENFTGTNVTGTVRYSANENRIIFAPDIYLTHDRPITATVKNLRDMDGNILEPYSWSFSSKQAIPPKIISRVPVAGQPLVPTDTSVRISFNKAMDETSIIDANFYIEGVTSTLEFSSDLKLVILTPTTTLEKNKVYTVIVDGENIRDKEGLAMGEDERWQFRTASGFSRLSTYTRDTAHIVDVKFNVAGEGLAISHIDSGAGTATKFYLYNGVEWSIPTTIATTKHSFPIEDAQYQDIVVAGNNLVWAFNTGIGKTKVIVYNGSGVSENTFEGTLAQILSNGSHIMALTYSANEGVNSIWAHRLTSTGWVSWEWGGINNLDTINGIRAGGDAANPEPFVIAANENNGDLTNVHLARFDGVSWSIETVFSDSTPSQSVAGVRVASNSTEHVVAIVQKSTEADSVGINRLRFFRSLPGGWSSPVTVIDDLTKNVSGRNESFSLLSNGADFMLGYVYKETPADLSGSTVNVETARIVSGVIGGRIVHSTQPSSETEEKLRLYTNGNSYLLVAGSGSTEITASVSVNSGTWSETVPVEWGASVAAGATTYAVHTKKAVYPSGVQPIRDELWTYAYSPEGGWSDPHVLVSETRDNNAFLPVGVVGAKNHSFEVIWSNDLSDTVISRRLLTASIDAVSNRTQLTAGSSSNLLRDNVGGSVLNRPSVLVSSSTGLAVWKQRDVQKDIYFVSTLVPGSGLNGATELPSGWGVPVAKVELGGEPSIVTKGNEYILVWRESKKIKEIRYSPANESWSNVVEVADFTLNGATILNEVVLATNGTSLVAVVGIGTDLFVIESRDGNNWEMPTKYSVGSSNTGRTYDVASNGTDYLIVFGSPIYSTRNVKSVHIDGDTFSKTVSIVDNISRVSDLGNIKAFPRSDGFFAVWSSDMAGDYGGIRYRYYNGSGWDGTEASTHYEWTLAYAEDLRVVDGGGIYFLAWKQRLASGIKFSGNRGRINRDDNIRWTYHGDVSIFAIAALGNDTFLTVYLDKSSTGPSMSSDLVSGSIGSSALGTLETDIENINTDMGAICLPENDISTFLVKHMNGTTVLHYSTSQR